MPNKVIIRSFEEENKRRFKLRIIFLIISLPFLLILGLFAAKVFTLFVDTSNAINSYETGNYEEATESLIPQKETNFIQPWLVYFNLGTVNTERGEYADGLSDLRVALDLVGNDLVGECTIRANLAISYERYGDFFNAEGDVEQADTNYQLAVEVVETAPPACFPPSSGGTGSEQGESLESTGERAEDKQSGDGEEEESPDGENGESESPAKTPEEQIEDQLEQSQEDRESIENLDREEAGTGGGQNEPYEKPW